MTAAVNALTHITLKRMPEKFKPSGGKQA